MTLWCKLNIFIKQTLFFGIKSFFICIQFFSTSNNFLISTYLTQRKWNTFYCFVFLPKIWSKQNKFKTMPFRLANLHALIFIFFQYMIHFICANLYSIFIICRLKWEILRIIIRIYRYCIHTIIIYLIFLLLHTIGFRMIHW